MVEQNLISKNHRIRKLQDGEVVQSFNCGDTELNDFILNKAADYKKSLLAVSYVLEDNGNYQKNGFVMLNEFQKERRTQPMFFDLAQLT